MWDLISTLVSIFVGPEFLRAFKAAPFGVWDYRHDRQFHSLDSSKGYGQQRFEDDLRVVKDLENATSGVISNGFDPTDPLQVSQIVVGQLNHSILQLKRKALDKLYSLVPGLNFNKIGHQLAEHFLTKHKQVLHYFLSSINKYI